jgi:WD40 repeat protein
MARTSLPRRGGATAGTSSSRTRPRNGSSKPFGLTAWELPAGTPRGAPLTGLTGFADTVGLAPDGRTAVGADSAGKVLLWDVPTRSTIGDALPGPVAGRNAAASFTPDGHRVVVVSDTGKGWVWDVKRSDWLARACQVAGRSLTQQEWRGLLPDRPYHATCGS